MKKPRRNAKRLDQRKLDAKRSGWPWPIEHPNDERALLDGYYPDFAAAERVREFFADLLCVPNDRGRGVKPFILLDWWYRDVLAPIFGWKRPGGGRRFDKAFISTAKKSGKSTVLAGLPLYMLLADGEEEAECYSAATDLEQAAIIYRKAARMVTESRELRGVVRCTGETTKRIVHAASGGYFQSIPNNADGIDGANPHLLIADELHRWTNRNFFNALMYGDIVRRQPLFLMITTAGESRECVGFEEYEFAKRLLSGENYSPSHFAFIAEAPGKDLDEIWDKPESWRAANPSIDAGLGSVEKLAAKCEEAKQIPAKKREFIRFICNRWVEEGSDPWIQHEAWQRCGGELVSHDGEDAWGGLDLSSVNDLTALCLAFPDGEEIALRWWLWMPEGNIRHREDEWRVPLRDWIDAGWIETTPGDVVDYAWIRKAITGVCLDERGQPLPPIDDCLANQYDIREIAYDRHNAQKLVTELGEYDGLAMHEHGQGFAGMAGPCKEFQRLVLGRGIRHGDNPVASWMIRGCVADSDPAGNQKLNKRKSTHKIDGIVAAVMAVGRAVAGEDDGESVYDGKESLAL
jgi:phage terminase large subunit-like protein